MNSNVPNRIPSWQSAHVVDRTDLGPGIASLTIRLSAPFEFFPGQFINVLVQVEGRSRPLQRSYSIASAPTPGTPSETVEIVISVLEGGVASPLLVEYEAGRDIEVRGPFGLFLLDEESVPPLYFAAAGSGIVPFLSMIRYIDQSEQKIPVTMLLSNRSHEYVIAGDELEVLDARADWFKIVHTYTRSDAPIGGYGRRIDAEMLRETGALEAGSAYVCGPPEMCDKTVTCLEEIGVKVDIYTEAYT